MKPFDQYDYDDVRKLFNTKVKLTGRAAELTGLHAMPRRPPSAIAATKYRDGDHWQNGKGFIGQLPHSSVPGWRQITQDIKDAFVSENVVAEVEETHIAGVLGREPLWSFLPAEGKAKEKGKKKAEGEKKTFEQATGESLTDYWNEREALTDLQQAAGILVREGTAVRRIFFPRGLLKDGSEIPKQASITDALDFIFFETLTADVAGVFKDPDTQKELGAYLFEERDDAGDVIAQCAELSFLDEEGNTVCRVVKDKGAPEEFPPYKLGGRLLIHQMQRRPLITEQVQSQQRALNLAHTKLTRNVDNAGSRERTVTNAQQPRQKKKIQDPNNPTLVREVSEPSVHETGGGAVMYLLGYPIRNEKNQIIGYTNPGIDVHDPSPVEVFTEARANHYTAILSECHMRHLLIAGDALASGESRKQAEKGYQRSLKDSKTPLDASGRWQLETTLRLAAQLTGEIEKYLALRADFGCLLDIGEPSADDRRLANELRKPAGPNNQPLISDETARNWAGIDDAEAERVKIEAEAPTDAEIAARQALMQPPVKPQVNGDAEVVN